MAAGLQGDIGGRTSRVVTIGQGFYFRMGPAEMTVIPLTDQLAVANQDATDHRIRFDSALTPLGQFKCQPHPMVITGGIFRDATRGHWHQSIPGTQSLLPPPWLGGCVGASGVHSPGLGDASLPTPGPGTAPGERISVRGEPSGRNRP